MGSIILITTAFKLCDSLFVVLSARHKVEYKPQILTHYKLIVHTKGNI